VSEGGHEMKKKRYILAGLLVVVIAVVLVAVFVFMREPVAAYTPPIIDAEGNEIPGSIAVIETVILGGVEQTVTVVGAMTFIGTFGIVLRPLSFFTLFGLMLTAVWQIVVGVKLYKLG